MEKQVFVFQLLNSLFKVFLIVFRNSLVSVFFLLDDDRHDLGLPPWLTRF